MDKELKHHCDCAVFNITFLFGPYVWFHDLVDLTWSEMVFEFICFSVKNVWLNIVILVNLNEKCNSSSCRMSGKLLLLKWFRLSEKAACLSHFRVKRVNLEYQFLVMPYVFQVLVWEVKWGWKLYLCVSKDSKGLVSVSVNRLLGVCWKTPRVPELSIAEQI